METLPKVIQSDGRTLRQIKREGMTAIYDVRNDGNCLYGYEVIIIRVLPAKVIFNRQYPERESYPSNSKQSSDWGSLAWSFGRKDKLRALAMFNSLVKKEAK